MTMTQTRPSLGPPPPFERLRKCPACGSPEFGYCVLWRPNFKRAFGLCCDCPAVVTVDLKQPRPIHQELHR